MPVARSLAPSTPGISTATACTPSLVEIRDGSSSTTSEPGLSISITIPTVRAPGTTFCLDMSKRRKVRVQSLKSTGSSRVSISRPETGASLPGLYSTGAR